ncbi:hypothetical protein B7R54_00475 [Subtercola boreus]|uniref:Amine oxidase domain-containing protein n=1 Tax=Subtercola boreus TaxID=120213 RepID=A0A3E0VDX5_9MICO|nr:NAD(P)/FAD-dependent oxidoreductase [Subtercola boreus]RFA07855.1 hypothetical protein B7R54_00475 [Subtercola boreus]TQL55294.1 putative NAD(P)-binding protein [Subtercola boreus]
MNEHPEPAVGDAAADASAIAADAVDAAVDVAIVGGGHNGLVAAAYLARAGLAVTVLERLPEVGGAAVSASPFEGVDARLSRYSYLVSLLPRRIIDDLGLDITLVRRRFSSYTPVPGSDRGLLVDTADVEATTASFAAIGAARDAALFLEFYDHCAALARELWPTMTEPLRRRSELRAQVVDAGAPHVWEAMVEHPIGELIEAHIQNDTVRGVMLTDALIGTFARAHDADLAQNICFLYHLIGGGTGDWDVPVGGMGAVTAALHTAALDAGATVVRNAEVTALTPDGVVTYRAAAAPAAPAPAGAPATATLAAAAAPAGPTRTLRATTVLANVAPAVLTRLLAAATTPTAQRSPATPAPFDRSKGPELLERGADGAVGVLSTDPIAAAGAAWAERGPEGAQAKVNLLLSRLPRLRDETVTPEAAFGGTFHINEGYRQLDDAWLAADGGALPDPLPAEIYCHSLTDPSILSPELQAAGAQTLTVFALHVPHRLVTEATNDTFRAEVQAAVLASLNSVLAEPIEDCLMLDAAGEPCIETKTTLDLEHALRIPGGNIFHGPLSWPWADDDEPLDTPAERWGVATEHRRILLCGSGSRRGGAVSGLGGHSAAMAVLEALGLQLPGAE